MYYPLLFFEEGYEFRWVNGVKEEGGEEEEGGETTDQQKEEAEEARGAGGQTG